MKGIKKAKSKLGAFLQIGAVLHFELAQNKSSLATITGLQSIFLADFVTYEKLQALSSVLEITQQVCQENQALPHVYDLLNHFLQSLDQTDKHELLQMAYEIQMFTSLGFLGDFRHCTQCHKKIELDVCNFIPEEGVQCKLCSASTNLHANDLKVLVFLQESYFHKIAALALSEEELKKLSWRVHQVRDLHLRRKLKSES